MIRRVWEVLALQRHSVMLQMRMRAIDPVPHVHLHSGLRRLHLQRASRHRIRQSTSHFPPISTFQRSSDPLRSGRSSDPVRACRLRRSPAPARTAWARGSRRECLRQGLARQSESCRPPADTCQRSLGEGEGRSWF